MKKEKTTLPNKLTSYSALAGSLIAIGSSVDAQVVYTNITDYTAASSGDSYALDLNNDSNTDFNITLSISSISTTYGKVSIRQINAMKVSSNDVINFGGSASALPANSSISASKSWGGSSAAIMAIGVNSINLGKWVGATDMYLGLKFLVTGSTHYGWARLDVSANSDQFTIKDYAYDKKPDKAIKAGDKGFTTSIAENKEAGISVHSFNKTITVYLNDENNSQAIISVKNVLGQEIKNTIANNKKTNIEMNDVNTGVYFVNVTQGGIVSTSKVYIQ